jgi:hypothetical protein
MRECDLLKAVEQAAFRYLLGLLINRVGKLLRKRALAVLVILVGAPLADGPLPIGDIIGLIVAVGIGLWCIYDVVKTIRDVLDRFRTGIWQMFKKLPQQLLDDFLLDCLNRKPECCDLFQREAGNLLFQWVKGLKPGWKKGSPITGSTTWRQMQRDIKRRIAAPLRECCTR